MLTYARTPLFIAMKKGNLRASQKLVLSFFAERGSGYYNQRGIADALDVSRRVVRWTIAKLERDGWILVRVVPRKGTYITVRSDRVMAQSFLITNGPQKANKIEAIRSYSENDNKPKLAHMLLGVIHSSGSLTTVDSVGSEQAPPPQEPPRQPPPQKAQDLNYQREAAWTRDVLFKDLPLYATDPWLNAYDPVYGSLAIIALYRSCKAAYPVVDFVAEIRAAHAWECANPRKRKGSGRAAFLMRWMQTAHRDGGIFKHGPITKEARRQVRQETQAAEANETIENVMRMMAPEHVAGSFSGPKRSERSE